MLQLQHHWAALATLATADGRLLSSTVPCPPPAMATTTEAALRHNIIRWMAHASLPTNFQPSQPGVSCWLTCDSTLLASWVLTAIVTISRYLRGLYHGLYHDIVILKKSTIWALCQTLYFSYLWARHPWIKATVTNTLKIKIKWNLKSQCYISWIVLCPRNCGHPQNGQSWWSVVSYGYRRKKHQCQPFIHCMHTAALHATIVFQKWVKIRGPYSARDN